MGHKHDDLSYEMGRKLEAQEVLEKYLIPRRMLMSASEYLKRSTVYNTLFDNTFIGIAIALEVLDNAARKIYNDEIYDERQFKLKKRKQYANIK